MDTPVNTLPAELLSYIFEVYVQSLDHSRSSLSLEYGPFLVSRVCKHWWSVADATHSLWNTIHLTPVGDDIHHSTELLARWLGKSRDLPLDITLDMLNDDRMKTFAIDMDGSVYDRRFFRSAVGMLRHHRKRIRSLCAISPWSTVHEFGIEEMTALQTLQLTGSSELTLRALGKPLLLSTSDGAPTLRTLSIENLSLDLPSLFLQTQLTRLELIDIRHPSRLSPSMALHILTTFPSLEVCALDIGVKDIVPPDEVRRHSERVCLPNLKMLFLTWCDVPKISQVFDAIRTPNLTRLGIRGELGITVDGRPWTHLHEFLASGHCPLTHLSIGDTVDDDVLLVDCLRLCDDLTNLSINHISIEACSLLDALTWDEQNKVLPRLCALQLGVVAIPSQQNLLRMLHSRVVDKVGVGRLEELVMLSCMGLTSSGRRELEDLGIPRVTIQASRGNLPFGMGLMDFVRIADNPKDFFAL